MSERNFGTEINICVAFPKAEPIRQLYLKAGLMLPPEPADAVDRACGLCNVMLRCGPNVQRLIRGGVPVYCHVCAISLLPTEEITIKVLREAEREQFYPPDSSTRNT